MSTSPGTQQPFPSPPPLQPSSAPFYFPGPSSRYNQTRPRPKTAHSRPRSYTPVAPVLSTEKRAHRRAHTQSSSIPSPPACEYSRSPLSRFSSFSAKMAPQMPQTPAKSSRRSTSSLQTSPFSDYFTDEARSIDAQVSANHTKQLLVRMNKLQSRLMRDHPDSSREAIHIVGRKLSEIELELSALHSQSRMPSDIGDSAVFMDGEQDHGDNQDQATSDQATSVSPGQAHDVFGEDGDPDVAAEPVTIEQYKAERDYFIIRMQDLLEKLGTTQTELGKRYAEVHQLNEFHNSQLEECETQLEQLRSENEGLRSDLGFEYSELLFLKLQMKSLEVDMDSLNNDGNSVEGSAISQAQRTIAAKKNRILSEMDRWRSDWQDVDARFKRRRSKYGVSLDRCNSNPTSEAEPSSNDADWHLETTREGRGRITSLTIRRMDSSGGPTGGASQEEAPCLATTLKDAKTIGLDGLNISLRKGPGEPQIAKPSNSYHDYGTQTDVSLLSDPHPQAEKEDAEEEDRENIEEEGDGDQHHDCAITTSSEFEDDDDDEEDYDNEEKEEEGGDDEGKVTGRPLVSSPSRTAWQELWSSLAHLSGLPDDDDDDLL